MFNVILGLTVLASQGYSNTFCIWDQVKKIHRAKRTDQVSLQSHAFSIINAVS